MLIRRQLGDRFVDSTRRGTVILINVISPCKKCDELIAMPVAGERRKNLTALVYWIACNINTRESIATFHREAIISRFIFVAPVKSGRSIVDIPRYCSVSSIANYLRKKKKPTNLFILLFKPSCFFKVISFRRAVKTITFNYTLIVTRIVYLRKTNCEIVINIQ